MRTQTGPHGAAHTEPVPVFWPSFKKLARGDASVLTNAFDRHVARVTAQLDRVHGEGSPGDGQLSADARRDVAIISGMALTMLGVKVLKLLPGLPFAPGHKGIILLPLYLLAAAKTRTRFGATLTGATMGTVAFLLGDGRYGIFEIAKHIMPGLIIDLLYPLAHRISGTTRTRRLLVWSTVGVTAALGRFGTVMLVTIATEPPAIVYAILLPGLLVHAIFGALSGIIALPLLSPPQEESP